MLSQPCSILSQSVAGLGILRGRAWQHGLEQYRLRMQSARSDSFSSPHAVLGRSEHPSAASGIFDHKVAERASLVHS